MNKRSENAMRETVSLNLDADLKNRMDEHRGEASRSAFARMLLKTALDSGYSYKTRGADQ